MTRVLHRPSREEKHILAAMTATAPPPVERPRAIPAALPSRQVGIGGTVIADLRAADAPVRPVIAPLPPLTDWSARLADAFGAVESALGWLAVNTARCLMDAAYAEYNAATGLYDSCRTVIDEVRVWRDENAALSPFATLTAGA